MESLNRFECPDGQTKNQYDCQYFRIENSTEFAFSILNPLDYYDVDIKMNIFRQTGLEFNTHKDIKVEFELFEIFLNEDRSVSSRTLLQSMSNGLPFSCKAGQWKCETRNILKEWHLKTGPHHYVMKFKNIIFSDIENIELILSHIDAQYQQMVVNTKVISLIICVVVSLVYYRKYKSLRTGSKKFEHKCILMLCFGVACLNDPFFFWFYFSNNNPLAIISSVLVLGFFSFLALFWLFMTESINQRVSSIIVNNKKVAFMGLYILIGLVTIVFPLAVGDTFLIFFKLINIVVALWTLFNIFQNLQIFSALQWKDRIFIIATAYFVFIYTQMLYKWQETIQIYSWNASKLLALTHMTNIYLFTVAYLYYPQPEESYFEFQRKESYNDSEEETELDRI